MKYILLFIGLSFLVSCAHSSTQSNPAGSAATGQGTAVDPRSTVPSALSEPAIKIESGGKTTVFKRSELLKLSSIKTLVAFGDPTYSKTSMSYTVVPATELFKGVSFQKGDQLVFSCLDGFSAPISYERLLNSDPQKGSIAYIAIEPTGDSASSSIGKPWPKLKDSQLTAGPFYVVWENPKKSNVKTEEWPFQLAGFSVKPSLEKLFPKTVPAALAMRPGAKGATAAVAKGYGLFMQNCFACHTLNGEGTSQMGPDLNIPYSPTEYLKPGFLQKLIRNPQEMRHWPQSKMLGFKPDQLSDKEVEAVIAYLKHMAARRNKAM